MMLYTSQVSISQSILPVEGQELNWHDLNNLPHMSIFLAVDIAKKHAYQQLMTHWGLAVSNE